MILLIRNKLKKRYKSYRVELNMLYDKYINYEISDAYYENRKQNLLAYLQELEAILKLYFHCEVKNEQ